jgi:hypothetical protein
VELQATPEGREPTTRASSTDGARIEAIAAVLRRGQRVEDHKCSDTGRVTFRLKDDSATEIGLLEGHDRRFSEYRAYSGGGHGIFRVDRRALSGAMSGLGVGHPDAGSEK